MKYYAGVRMIKLVATPNNMSESQRHDVIGGSLRQKSKYGMILFICMLERAKLAYGVSQGSSCPWG